MRPAWTFYDEEAGTTTVFKRRPLLTWLRNLFAVLALALFAPAAARAVGTYTENAAKATYQAVAVQEAPAFVAVPQLQITATNVEMQAFLLVNLATNTLSAFLPQLVASNPYGSGANTTYRVYLNPVVTSSGTAVVPTSNRLGLSQTAQLQVYTGPSASSTGTLVGLYTVGANASSAVFPLASPYGFQISTGTKVIVTALTTAASTATLNITWTERVP